jgi:hypothetical protein
LVEGHTGVGGTPFHYLDKGGNFRGRAGARRFSSAGEAAKAMRAAVPKARKLDFNRLQVVVA